MIMFSFFKNEESINYFCIIIFTFGRGKSIMAIISLISSIDSIGGLIIS